MEDLYRMLRKGHIEAQGIVDTLDAPVALLDEQLCVINVNPAFCVVPKVERDAAQELVLSETRHRGQNLFARTRALASETEAEGLSGVAYRDAFVGRFETLPRGQSLQDDFSTADFRRIAERTLEPFAGHVRLGPGPSAPLAATLIMPMVMVLHELMTNAANYGALSAPRGVVRLSWQQAGRPAGKALEVHWLEGGGPAVAPGGRRGFGSRLMQFGVTRGLGGTVEFHYEPGGLRVAIVLPVP